jgi:hypothetical protein
MAYLLIVLGQNMSGKETKQFHASILVDVEADLYRTSVYRICDTAFQIEPGRSESSNYLTRKWTTITCIFWCCFFVVVVFL